MPRKLNSEESAILSKWLKEHDICENKMHREFSDCVALAHLIKKFFPKMIDLHNYPSRNSTKLKIDNWETLNHKVLTKLGLQQNRANIERLAKATPGAIDCLLCDIMVAEKQSHKDEKCYSDQEQIWTENDEVMIINVNKRIGDAIVQVPQKMILYSIYEQKVRESLSKDSCISSANQKIAHLENIIKLKAERIDELCGQLAKLSDDQTSRYYKKKIYPSVNDTDSSGFRSTCYQ